MILGNRSTNLHKGVFLDVVFEPPELEVQNWRECFEDDSLLRILQTEAFRLVFILPI